MNESPTPQETTAVPTQGTSRKSGSIIPWIISGCLFILVIVMTVLIVLFATSDTSLKETLRNWIQEDNTTTEDADVTENSDDQDPDLQDDENTDTDIEIPVDITSEWSTYYNSSTYSGFKYPVDLTYEEDTSNPERTLVTFTGGNSITVFEAWFQTMTELDSQLSNMLANQCTDDITFSDVTYGDRPFRKAVEVPLQSCLAALGVTRDQELAAYGTLLPGEVVLTIRNQALNQEQLEALLSTVYAD